MPLATSPFPYFALFVVPLIILVILLTAIILFFRWYFHRFRQHKTARIIGILIIILPVTTAAILLFLSTRRHVQLVKIFDVKCNDNSFFPGTIIATDIVSTENVSLLLPISGGEEGKTVFFDSVGKPHDSWYNSDFCQKGQLFENKIKSRPLKVVTNGYGRIIEWHEYKNGL